MSIEEKKENYLSIKTINQLRNKSGGGDDATALLGEAKKQMKAVGKLIEEKSMVKVAPEVCEFSVRNYDNWGSTFFIKRVFCHFNIIITEYIPCEIIYF